MRHHERRVDLSMHFSGPLPSVRSFRRSPSAEGDAVSDDECAVASRAPSQRQCASNSPVPLLAAALQSYPRHRQCSVWRAGTGQAAGSDNCDVARVPARSFSRRTTATSTSPEKTEADTTAASPGTGNTKMSWHACNQQKEQIFLNENSLNRTCHRNAGPIGRCCIRSNESEPRNDDGLSLIRST